MLMTALTVLAAYQFWRHPDGYRAAVLGAALAAFVLTRAEAALLVPLLIGPLAVIAAKRNWKRAAVLASICTSPKSARDRQRP